METKDVLVMVSASPHARIRGIARYARDHGWNLMLESQLNHIPRGWWGDGALVMLKNAPTLVAYVRRLQRYGVPVVNLSSAYVPDDVPAVIGDNVRIGECAAEYFADRSFVHVAWFSTNWDHIQQLRQRAFAREWRRQNPQAEEPLRFIWSENASAAQRDDWRRKSAWLARVLATAPKPLGVFCYSDYDASHVLNICRAGGIDVPNEVAILGVDNNVVICENQSVPLSSVNHHHERIGYAGAALLGRLMAGGERPAAPLLIPPQGITTRRSTETCAVADPTLGAVLDFIEKHLDRPLGAAEIAVQMGLPRHRLDRLFAQETGRSVGAEILHRRLVRAKNCLRETRMTLDEIARVTGFCNSGYLSNIFRRELGVTPGRYRREHRVVVEFD